VKGDRKIAGTAICGKKEKTKGTSRSSPFETPLGKRGKNDRPGKREVKRNVMPADMPREKKTRPLIKKNTQKKGPEKKRVGRPVPCLGVPMAEEKGKRGKAKQKNPLPYHVAPTRGRKKQHGGKKKQRRCCFIHTPIGLKVKKEKRGGGKG